MVLGDDAIDGRGDLVLVEARVRQIEVDATFAVTDLAAGDFALHHGAQQMQAGVHAHMPMAPVPVDLGRQLSTGVGEGAARLGQVHDIFVVLSLAGIDNP